MKRLRAWLPLIVLVAAGITLFASGALNHINFDRLIHSHNRLQLVIATYPWMARLLYVLILAVVVATAVPASVIVTVAAGMLFGIIQATLLSTLGVVLGSWLLFFATRSAFGTSRRPAAALIERVRNGYAHHPLNYTLFVRLAPGLPWGGVTLALAWLRCPPGLFTMATAVGALVQSAVESTAGAGLRDGLARGQGHIDVMAIVFNPYILLSLGGLALLALLPLLFGHLHHPPPAQSPPRS